MIESIRLGIIGCGAVVEQGHLPACARSDSFRVTILVDSSQSQAERLAGQYGVPRVATDYRLISDEVDAVIVATPPHLHREQAGFFLERGIHVLCEKPLASTVKECEELVRLQEANRGAKLAVAHVRRFFFYAQTMKSLLDSGAIGEATQFLADEGAQYNWPARTDFAFRRALSSGGVVLDLGLHLLDLAVWLLGPTSVIRYGDDALGGLESNAEIRLAFANGASGRIRLSRTCERTNHLAIMGTHGWAQADVYTPDRVVVQERNAAHPQTRRAVQGQSHIPAFDSQLANFARAITLDQAPAVSVLDGLTALQLVEECFRKTVDRPLPQTVPFPGEIRWC